MTQEQMAEACNLSPGYIAQLEGPNSYFCPSLKTLFVMAEVLKVPVWRFLDIEES